MEAPEEVMVGSKEHTHILKGKRTKRQRPQSPIPFAITTNSSSGDAGGSGGGGFESSINGNNNNKNITTMLMLSPATSNEYNQNSTEEEEAMANCLILLAQGQSRESPPKQSDDDMGNYKFNSRRFMETASPTGTGKAGYYVYECKTCNRTFPSFQALGGHRASHKKPKAMAEEKRNFTLSSDEEEGHFKNISSLSLQLSNKVLYNNTNNNSNTKSKVHECSVCGAEFTSGQALGGHMRRHRGPIGTNTNLSLTPMAMESEEPVKKPRNVLSFDLDLNLPAPEDDHRESKFSFASTQQEKQQQQQQQQQKSPLVFSAPTLVDCHY